MTMEEVLRKVIDWEATGANLQELRMHNYNLRRYVCFKLRADSGNCSGDCMNCKKEMDRSISRSELGAVMNVSESVVANWEGARSRPEIEDLFLYCDISGVPLSEILVFEE